MHSSRNPLLGFSLALTASMIWATLPLAIQQVLKVIDAATLVWSRFLVAAVILLLLGFTRQTLPSLRSFQRKHWLLFLLGSLALTLNFVLFSEALHYISPTTTQVLWQLAPFGMMLSGVFVFGEQLKRFQKIGSLFLIIGLITFFNQNFSELFQFGRYTTGIILASSASLIWVVYGIVQKILLPQFSSAQILFIIYLACFVWLSPLATPATIPNLSGFALICFLYCCINTLIGYGAYGEALNQWDASKVSVITTTLPIFTMIFSWIAHWLAPEIFPALNMNLLSYMGAFIVVCGAILATIGDQLFSKT